MENIYMNKRYNLAIKQDEDNKILLSYELENEKIDENTEGILKELDEEIGNEVAAYFNITLSDYNVTLIDEKYSMEDDKNP